MGPQFRFSLMISAIFLIGMAVTDDVSYRIEQRQARAESHENAKFLLATALATRAYTVNRIRPLPKRVPGLKIGRLYDYGIFSLDLIPPDIDGYEVLRRPRAARVSTPFRDFHRGQRSWRRFNRPDR
jgi:hypothetical protein